MTSMETPLSALLRLTDMQWRTKQAALAALNAEETRIQGLLAQLDSEDEAARTGLAQNPLGRHLGLDLRWQIWAGRTRANLNMERARILARKEALMGEMRKSFGRKQAAKSLVRQERQRRRVRFKGEQLEELYMTMLRR